MLLVKWFKSKINVNLEPHIKWNWISLDIRIFSFHFNWLMSEWSMHFNIAVILKDPTKPEDDFIP